MGWFLLAARTRRGWFALVAWAALALLAPSSVPASGSTAMYVLRGTLSQYIAPGASVVGSVTITVTSANRQRDALAGMRLTVGIDSRTKVSGSRAALKDGAAGLVVVRGPADDPAALRGRTAVEVVAQGRGTDRGPVDHGKKAPNGDTGGAAHGDGGTTSNSGGDKTSGDKTSGDKGSDDGSGSGDKGGDQKSSSGGNGGSSGSHGH